MGYFKEQEYEFVKRTKIIIEQYDQFQIQDKEKYEVTLLLNCLVGLLILPQQHWIRKLHGQLDLEKDWGITSEHIQFIEGNANSVKDISTHIRNSISHYRFVVINNNKDIDSIEFKDQDRFGNLTFMAIISIANLRIFSLKLVDRFLSEMAKEKSY